MRNVADLITRRNLLRAGALVAGGAMVPAALRGQKGGQAGYAPGSLKPPTPAAELPIRLGIASYTFREFDSMHLIEFMHQLKTPYLNLKDMHLPLTPLADVAPMAAKYRAAGFTLT